MVSVYSPRLRVTFAAYTNTTSEMAALSVSSTVWPSFADSIAVFTSV